ncbi:hypothetical protein [Paenibacillus anseongense]|uniref:hypothetical protein n=1 Tax=Paenibacillus anseongense TaxID=2682845 RepID=UPI002DB64A57|nr:hypothetical protein [Paenibacillus anseongense]MEC0265147.1 hypothetical protein [Paenibacillus anseongense]
MSKPKRTECNKKQIQVIQDMIQNPYDTDLVIAERNGIHCVTICNWKKLGYFQDMFDKMCLEANRYTIPKAMMKRNDIMDGKIKDRNAGIILKASQDILDRSGLVPVQKIEQTTTINGETTVNNKIDVSKLSTEELEMLEQIVKKSSDANS